MKRASRILRSGGMTLLEVMVAIAVLAMIMVLIWSSTAQSLNAKEKVEQRDLAFSYGRVALHKILDDLAMAFLTPPPLGSPGEQKVPLTFFIAEGGGETDSMRFTSFSHLRYLNNSKEADQCKISYRMVPAERDEYGEGPRGMVLMRSEIPWLDYTTEVEGKGLALAEGIKEFNLEFYDSRKAEWTKEWDTEKVDWKGRLPKAVRVKLVLFDPSGEDEDVIVLTSAVLLPLREQIRF